eukprot:231782_1
MWRDLLAILFSTSSSFLVYYLFSCSKWFVIYWSDYWNILLAIAWYFIITTIMHASVKYYCKPYKSNPNPKHLIILVSGYGGHYICLRSLQNSFKNYFENKNICDNCDHIMVYNSRSNFNGFFFYTICKTNDGIRRGGTRLCNEIKSVLNENLSIDKLSIIGCSLGGIFSRYALNSLFDSININTINGRSIELVNFITLASPHCGVADLIKQSKLCCNGKNTYKCAQCLAKSCLLPLTLKQLMLLDNNKLLMNMASNDDYILPLKLFEKHIAFGNAKYDTLVSCESALLLHGINECKCGEDYWNEIENNQQKCCCKELIVYDNIDLTDDEKINIGSDTDDTDFGICWFQTLKNEINWVKIMVAWNENKCTRCRSHRLLAAPLQSYSPSKAFFEVLHRNFNY